MSCDTNSNKDKEQNEDGKTTNLVSPFPNEVECFDNAESFPDMELVVKGIPKPLLLHRKVIASASEWFKTSLSGKKDMRLEWPFDTSKEVDREALLKALRFCYGQTLTVGSMNGECIAMAVVLSRLQVTCLDNAMTTLGNFAMQQAKQKVETGVELLMMCSQFTECCGTSQSSLNKKLASVVLTKDNMVEHEKEVVDECLMMLPAEYLSMADFGSPHTRWSEFSLRAKYARIHSKQMTKDERLAMVGLCDWSTLNSIELKELRLANIIDNDQLLDAQEKALKSCETEKERVNEMLRKMEKEKEDAVKERDGAVERANQAIRERDEKVREVESLRVKLAKIEEERDTKARDVDLLKKRLEDMEKEREKHWSRVDGLESLVKGNRLF